MYSFVEIRHIIRVLSVLLCALECCKIAFHFAAGNGDDLNTWVPLYFCSIGMFAGLLSGFATGALQHIGDVFLATGGLIGGICFLLYPSSSLMIYPSYHFLSIHSFLYHGVLTYMGILINRSGLYQLKMDDLKVYAMYVLGFCALAWIINANKGTIDVYIRNIQRDISGSLLEGIWQTVYADADCDTDDGSVPCYSMVQGQYCSAEQTDMVSGCIGNGGIFRIDTETLSFRKCLRGDCTAFPLF
jgi:hypothetical protein